MKKLATLFAALFFAAHAHAQSTITLPYAAQVAADIGNGPIKVRVTQGNASIFTSQGSGVGSTPGSSTSLTLTGIPTTPPIVGALISGTGITSGTTIAAYNGTTGVTLSAVATVPASTALSWGAACPSSAAGIPTRFIQASASADYYLLYTQARVCAVSPGGPANTLLVLPIFYEGTTSGASGVVSWNGRSGTVVPAANDYNFNQLAGSIACSQYAALTGDVTMLAGTCNTVLATVNANVGTFGSATQCVTATANAKGLITAVSAGTCTPAFSSLTGSIAVGQIPNSLITYAKIQNVGASKLLGNPTGGAAAPSEITLGTNLSFAGSVLNATGGSAASGFYTLQYISGAWGCTDPTGATVSIAGSTTSGLQECVNAMQSGKTGNFRAVCPSNASTVIAATTTVTLGPAGGYYYDLRGCNFTSTASSGQALVIDTFSTGSRLDWGGGFINCNITTASGTCVLVKAHSLDPRNSSRFFQQSTLHFPALNANGASCSAGYLNDGILFDATTDADSQIINNSFIFDGIDGNANFCFNYGIRIVTIGGASQAFVQNFLKFYVITNFKNTGLLICSGMVGAFNCATNKYEGAITIGTAVSNGISSASFLDQFFITSISVNAGSLTNGILLSANATGNWFIVPQVEGTTPFNNGGTNNKGFVNGAYLP